MLRLSRLSAHLGCRHTGRAQISPAAAGSDGAWLEDLGLSADEDVGEMTVPEWQLGVWARTIITFSSHTYLGREIPELVDDSTFVLWLQTSHRCADIRLASDHPGHPQTTAAARPPSLSGASREQLLVMAEADGWSGCCRAVGSEPVSMGAPTAALTAVNDWFNVRPPSRRAPRRPAFLTGCGCCLAG